MKKLDLLNKIKELDLTQDEKAYLINLVNTKKKYGLVWEDKPEEVEEELRNNLPVLKEVKDRAIINDTDTEKHLNHLIIEGDNLHGLTTLSFTHDSKVDLIYIDPPYNTGAKNWRYNNDYVDKEDAFRHSKFISFLERRFKIAKRLLSQKGIIICAIDDYECHNVRHLMDEMFGEQNRLGTIVVVHNPRGRNDDKFIATMHEYMLVYAKDANSAEIKHLPLSDDDIAKYNKEDEISRYNETSYVRTGNNSLREERPNLYYPIFYNPKTDSLALYKSNGSIELLPINAKGEHRTWRWGQPTFLERKGTELLVRKVKGEYRIFKKRRLTDIEGKKVKTIWADSKFDASSNGIILMQDIFGGSNPFPYPKSFYALLDTLQIATDKDSIILDYFSGSGTTLHATMALNDKDNGKRTCILVTNNENNICEEVTYERNKRVIQGYSRGTSGGKVAPLSTNNLRYFKCQSISREPSLKNKKQLTQLSTELLCIKEQCYNECSSLLAAKQKWVSLFTNSNGRYLCVIYDDAKIEEAVTLLIKFIGQHKPAEKIRVYVFANGQYPYTEEFEDILDHVTLCALPDAIYKAYQNVLPKKQREFIPEIEEASAEETANTGQDTIEDILKSENGNEQ